MAAQLACNVCQSLSVQPACDMSALAQVQTANGSPQSRSVCHIGLGQEPKSGKE